MAWISFLLAAVFSVGALVDNGKHCATKDLTRKDCLLKIGNYQVQLSKLKLTWNDGTWTSIADMPMSGDDFDWEKIELANMGGRWLVQMWIWDAGKGEAKVQSLHWLVGEMKDRKYSQLLDQIVRRREVRSTKPLTYSFDKMTPHHLTKSHETLRWTVGRQAGVI